MKLDWSRRFSTWGHWLILVLVLLLSEFVIANQQCSDAVDGFNDPPVDLFLHPSRLRVQLPKTQLWHSRRFGKNSYY